MSTSVRARHDARGFSFVELLVTIVIAGIAFTAMVPMFVQAQEKNSADLFRSVSRSIAQAKIEKIRALDYAAITQPNLTSNTDVGGSFGATQTFSSGSSVRSMDVVYQVTDYDPNGAVTTPSKSTYKLIQVTVSWTGRPRPVKPVVLQTTVYRQYAGPTFQEFSTTPAMDESGMIAASPSITLTAIPTVPWYANIKQVDFAIANPAGVTIATATVKTTDPGSGYNSSTHRFSWTWSPGTIVAGSYDFSAVGLSLLGVAGETIHLYPALQAASQTVPVAPVLEPALSQDRAVTVSWGGLTGVDHYDVYRGTSQTGPWTKVGTVLAASSVTSYQDTGLDLVPPGLVNGTTYWYTVEAVNSIGRSPQATPVSATPVAAADQTAPNPPELTSVAKVSGQQQLFLTWTDVSATDTDFDGKIGYAVYRCSSNSPTLSDWVMVYNLVAVKPLPPLPPPATTWTDPATGWGVTWWYKVIAFDGTPNFSAFSTTVSQTSVTAVATYDVTIQNTHKNKALDVWVESGGLYYGQNGTSYTTKGAAPTVTINVGSSKVWNYLPSGDYNVTCQAPSVNVTVGRSTSSTTWTIP